MKSALPFKLLGHRGFRALFSAQLLGAFNDNFFKMLVSLLAVDAAGAGQSGAYVSLVGIVFMLPFLLFAGFAGYAADTFDRRRVLVTAKMLEIAIMVPAGAALVWHRVDLLLPVLFLLATQATFFGPAKSGLLPDMLPAEALPRANGMLEMGRYAAVILGTAVGGLTLDLWADQPAVIGLLLVAVAVSGCVAALRVPGAPASWNHRPFCLSPWSRFKDGCDIVARDHRLVLAISGLSYFECLGALVLLDLILVGKEVMALDDTRIGLLGAAAGCGIGIGCVTAGRLSRGRIAAALVLFGGTGIGLSVLALSMATASYILLIVITALAGFFGGFVIVPLNTALQSLTDSTERGTVISTNNFFNMTAVFLSSTLLWLLRDGLAMQATEILRFAGLVTLAIMIAVSRHFRRRLNAGLLILAAACTSVPDFLAC